jgi:murein DD-endopeptidase MepM/ murein hydrolase activator NlpD
MGRTLTRLKLMIAAFLVAGVGWLAIAGSGNVTLESMFTLYRGSATQPSAKPLSSPTNAPEIERQAPPLRQQSERPILPVAGVRPDQLFDTFAQARAEGARSHDAIDIPAPLGTPVLAAVPGTIEKLFLSRDGGNTLYLRSRDRLTIYYYAHLDGYAPGLSDGQLVQSGEVIGTVGYSGNANPSAPHLHFAVWQTTADAGWYGEHRAVNPYPLLRGR